MSDHYRTMGVAPTATTAEIKDAYHRLALELHPDRTKGDKLKEARFKEVSAAYEVLCDPALRAEYDRQRQPPAPPAPRPTPVPRSAPLWPSQIVPTPPPAAPTRPGTNLGGLMAILFGIVGAVGLAGALSSGSTYYDPTVDRTRGPDGRFRRS